MTNLRSVGALLAISAALSCATAINDGTVPGPPTASAAGANSGGAPGMGEGGGVPTGGTPEQAGQPGSAGKGVAGSATSSGGKGGSGSGSAGSGSAGKGSAGAVGVAGSNAGGSAGTSSSGGAGGSSAGAGGATVGGGYCENPIDLPASATNTGNIGKAAACFRVKASFNAITCSSMDDRTVKVNGMLAKCSTVTTFPAAIDGWSYFEITAGMIEWAQVGWYKG